MKRPFDAVREIFFDHIVRTREDYKATIEQAHSFIAWLVGFSVGGLYLILSNLDKSEHQYGHSLIKTILALLTTSIITGVIYRVAISVYQDKLRGAMFYIEGSFSTRELMPAHPADISTLTDVRQLQELLKLYGEDISVEIENYIKGDEQARIRIWEELKQRYKGIAEWAERDHIIAVDNAKNIYQKAYGLSKKKLDKEFADYSSKPLKIWGYVCTITFYLSCLCFLAVPILFCIIY